jgi:dipeptidyl aminopeptidase/acylaminoacyl peptidase
LRTGAKSRINPADTSVTSLDVSADGSVVAAVLESVERPPYVAAWTAETRQWQTLTDFGSNSKLEQFGEVKWLKWRSKDDCFDINGILVMPPELKRQIPAPLVVCVEGGNEAGSGAQKMCLLVYWSSGPSTVVISLRGFLRARDTSC